MSIISLDNLPLYHQAYATGRSDKTVREFLEKHYSDEAVSTEEGAIKLVVKALLEVVQSGAKNVEVAIMRPNQPMRVSFHIWCAIGL